MFILLMIIAHTALAVWTAWATGKAWVEAQYAGGSPLGVAWTGAITAGTGLSWCILLLLILMCVGGGWVPPFWGEFFLHVGYFLLIPAVIMAVVIYRMTTWAGTYRTRVLGDFGQAAFNVFADTYNSYHAVSGPGPSFGKVVEGFFGSGDSGVSSDSGGGSSDSKGKGGVLVVLLLLFLAAVAIAAGGLITAAIIHHAAASEPLEPYEEADSRRPMQSV